MLVAQERDFKGQLALAHLCLGIPGDQVGDIAQYVHRLIEVRIKRLAQCRHLWILVMLQPLKSFGSTRWVARHDLPRSLS